MFLAVTLTLASASGLTSPPPAMISEVAKLLRTATLQGESFPVYEYEAVRISGDLPVADFRDLMTATRPHLGADERIVALVVTRHHPLDRHRITRRDSDFQVQTCQRNCSGPARDATGRIFLFKRTREGLRFLRLYEGYIE
jgi:hypothetical protein